MRHCARRCLVNAAAHDAHRCCAQELLNAAPPHTEDSGGGPFLQRFRRLRSLTLVDADNVDDNFNRDHLISDLPTSLESLRVALITPVQVRLVSSAHPAVCNRIRARAACFAASMLPAACHAQTASRLHQSPCVPGCHIVMFHRL